MAVREGIPAHETATKWREAGTQESNAEGCLIALLSTCALVAYPFELKGSQPAAGGWETGPVHVPVFEQDGLSFPQLIKRLISPGREMLFFREGLIVRTRASSQLQQFPRLSFRGVYLFGLDLGADFSGANFDNANLVGSNWLHCDLSGASLRGANLRHATFFETKIDGADFDGAETQHANLDGKKLGRPTGKRVAPRRKKKARVARKEP